MNKSSIINNGFIGNAIFLVLMVPAILMNVCQTLIYQDFVDDVYKKGLVLLGISIGSSIFRIISSVIVFRFFSI